MPDIVGAMLFQCWYHVGTMSGTILVKLWHHVGPKWYHNNVGTMLDQNGTNIVPKFYQHGTNMGPISGNNIKHKKLSMSMP
jgi:hypothetical protein